MTRSASALSPGPRPDSPDSPVIDVRGFGFRFEPDGAWVLDAISLRIESGEFVLLAGPSGSGKSLLALALSGYLLQRHAGETTGSVSVANLDAATTPLPLLADAVGLVQQDPESQLCTLTVQDEVAFGLENRGWPRAEIAAQVRWALTMVGGEHLLERSTAELSGGEQQKVAIAAAIAARPRILILDEPTSSLDPPSTREVLDCLGRLRREAGLTVVVIEHKLARLLPVASRLVVLAGGRVVVDAPVAIALTRHREQLLALGLRLPASGAATIGDPVPGMRRGEACAGPGGTHRRAQPESAGEPPAVLVRDLCVERAGRLVLREVSLAVRRGELVTLMGDNGSGKSSLLLCLLGLVKPTAGQLTVLGRDVADTPVSLLARDIGFVFQNPDHQLFCDSVWHEAVFAARNFGLSAAEADPRADRLLTRCGLAGYMDRHPYRLSYGEKRRLNICSGMCHQPGLLLLDEPLVGQDWGNSQFLLAFLAELLAAGIAVVMVGHDPELAATISDRIVFLRHGRVLVDAAPDEAFLLLARAGEAAYQPTGQ